jgi:hypothetical protein
MDYADNFDEFERMLDQFCYNINFQLECIEQKIKHFIDCYNLETTDAARAACLEYIGKLNNLYVDYLLDKARLTLGLGWQATQEDFKRRRDVLLDRYKGGKDKDSIKMHNDIEKAYDLLQCFKA